MSGSARMPTLWVMPDPQRRGVDVVEGGHVGLGGPQPAEDRLGVVEQHDAGGGQLDPGPAAAADERRPTVRSSVPDVGAHGRRHVPELGRGAAERSRLRDRAQRRQVARLDAEPSRLATGHAGIPLQCGASAARTASMAASARSASSGR